MPRHRGRGVDYRKAEPPGFRPYESIRCAICQRFVPSGASYQRADIPGGTSHLIYGPARTWCCACKRGLCTICRDNFSHRGCQDRRPDPPGQSEQTPPVKKEKGGDSSGPNN